MKFRRTLMDAKAFRKKLIEYADKVRNDNHVGAEKYNKIVYNTIMTVLRMLEEQPKRIVTIGLEDPSVDRNMSDNS